MAEKLKQPVDYPRRACVWARQLRTHAALKWMGLVMLLAAGCAKDSGKRKLSSVKSSKAEASAVTAAQKTPPGEAWHPRLGKVLVVKDKMEFVLVDIGTAPAPAAGTILLAYTDANPSAELAVSSFQKRPYLIADIVSGEPKMGDTVVVKPSPPAASPQASSQKSKPAPALSGDVPPKFAPFKLRAMPSSGDAAERDPFSLPEPRETRGGADNASNGEGIIPGLPPRTPR